MLFWIRRIVLAGLTIVVVWALVLMYWQAAAHFPSVTDVAVYLLLLPVIVFFLILGIRKITLAVIAFSSAHNSANAIAVQSNSSAQLSGIQPETTGPLFIVADSAITRLGSTATEIVDSITSRKTNFELDPLLVDGNGYPVLSGRILHLDENEVFARFVHWGAESGSAIGSWQPEDKRALVLAHDVFMQLSQTILWQLLHAELISAKASKPAGELPMLHLITALPDRWQQSQKQVVGAWLAEIVMQQGWPPDNFRIHAQHALNEKSPIALIERIGEQDQQRDVSGFYILLASQSYLGENAFAELHAMQRGRGEHGKYLVIPGEAAAGMVVVNAQWLHGWAVDSHIRMHPLVQRKRDKSADTIGKVSPAVLIDTLREALLVAHTSADNIVTVTAATDARGSRIGELFEALYDVVPDVDPAARCFKLEAACGVLGAVAEMLTLITARQLVIDDQLPVLCVSNTDDDARYAWVMDKVQTSPA